MKSVLRSIGAVAAGLVLIAIFSGVTDDALENAGVLPKGTLPSTGPELLLVGVLGYRAVFSLAGCYLAARLAPGRPIGHVLALGGVGLVIGAAGSVFGRDLQPTWFGVVLTSMALPIAYWGGRLSLGRAPVGNGYGAAGSANVGSLD